jgi:hypothetical protein
MHVLILFIFESLTVGWTKNSLSKLMPPPWASKNESTSGSFRTLFGVKRCSILLNIFGVKVIGVLHLYLT